MKMWNYSLGPVNHAYIEGARVCGLLFGYITIKDATSSFSRLLFMYNNKRCDRTSYNDIKKYRAYADR